MTVILTRFWFDLRIARAVCQAVVEDSCIRTANRRKVQLINHCCIRGHDRASTEIWITEHSLVKQFAQNLGTH